MTDFAMLINYSALLNSTIIKIKWLFDKISDQRSIWITVVYNVWLMINNYFDEVEYHSLNSVYTHHTYRTSLYIGDASAALDIDTLIKNNIKTGNSLLTKSSPQLQAWITYPINHIHKSSIWSTPFSISNLKISRNYLTPSTNSSKNN